MIHGLSTLFGRNLAGLENKTAGEQLVIDGDGRHA